MKTWTGRLDIAFVLTEDEIKNDKWVRNHFNDPNNPTNKEVKKYFADIQDQYAGSNDGSELIANADLIITCVDDEDNTAPPPGAQVCIGPGFDRPFDSDNGCKSG